MSDFLDANQILSQLDGRLSGPVHVVVCGGLVIEVQYGGPGSRDIDSLDALSGELEDCVNDLHRMLRGSRWEKTKAQISKIIKENIR